MRPNCHPLLAPGAFQLWAPRLYAYYRRYMQHVEQQTPEKRNFASSIFACASMNFGPQVRCFRHRDSLNLPFGWCSIQALGDFDPKTGGHFILWDAKLVIEFPAGSTILIPSATLTHSNTAIQEHEVRVSFTQYTAGGIFRWVDNGFQTEAALMASDYGRYMEMQKAKEMRWSMGLALYSTMDELLERV